MEIRKANIEDCRSIAELALMAGEGIPAYFWAQSKNGDQEIIDVGTLNAASEDENFSYRNVHLALIDNKIASMLLAYRLPDSEDNENLEDFPEFIRPLIELEQCVPSSFYINMLAAYPELRKQGIGTKLMSTVDRLAAEAGCTTISVEVFEQNQGAFNLYQRLGYKVIERRDIIEHECHPYDSRILLLTKITQTA